MADANSVVAAWQAMAADVQAIGVVTPPIPAPTITNLTATPSSLPSGGGSVVVNGMVTNATVVMLDAVPVALPFTASVTASHTFTLTASGPTAPPAQAQVTVDVAIIVVPPPSGGILANLARGTARNMGNYVNPHPDWWPSKGKNITDDSGCAADPKRNQFLLFGGAHGPSQETDIRGFNTLTGKWSSLYPSTLWKDMLLANRAPNGRWINTNQPCARHTYGHLVVRDDELYCMTAYCQTDYLPAPCLPYIEGTFCSYDLAGNGGWKYSAHRRPWLHAGGAAHDPVSGNIYIFAMTGSVGRGRLWKYDPVTDAKPEVGPNLDILSQPVDAAYCPLDDKFYAFEKGGVVRRVTIDRANLNASTYQLLATTGPTAVNARPWGYPSFTWDSVNKRFGGCFITGKHYEFDPVSLKWTATTVQVEAGSTGLPSNDFSCSAFMEDVGCYIFVQIAPTPTTWAFRP